MLTILNGIDKDIKKLVLLLGDVNLDLLKSDSYILTGDFLNFILFHSFLPIIHSPTKITDNVATLIDIIFINRTQYSFVTAIVHNDLSDHLSIILYLKTGLVKKYPPHQFQSAHLMLAV